MTNNNSEQESKDKCARCITVWDQGGPICAG